MKTNKPFFDTNVLLSLLSEDTRKANRAEAIMTNGGIISVQVLNEFASVASRKLKMSYTEIHDVLRTVRAICDVKSITIDTHELGLNIAERYHFSFYDSLIISSSLQANCTVLYSEDMQHSQKVDGQLLILNPFLD